MTAVLCAVLIIIGVIFGGFEINSRLKTGVGMMTFHKYSWASQRVIVAYHNLPKDYRPKTDIFEVLSALEFKNGGKTELNEFTSYSEWTHEGTVRGHRWAGGDGWRPADKIREFEEIHTSFVELSEELETQKHSLALSGMSHRLDEAKSLVEDARRTKNIVRTVTKEMQ